MPGIDRAWLESLLVVSTEATQLAGRHDSINMLAGSPPPEQFPAAEANSKLGQGRVGPMQDLNTNSQAMPSCSTVTLKR